MNDLYRFGPDATAIAFPLGGIGTGNVSIGARGDLRDWELDGEPAKGTTLPNAFFGLWIGGSEATIRVIEGPLPNVPQASHGYHPTTHAGIPRFRDSTFVGTYPVARVEFADPSLPVTVGLEAWTPLVPLDPDESGIPTAIFEFSIENTSEEHVDTSVVASLMNPIGEIEYDPFGMPTSTRIGRTHNRAHRSENLAGVVFDNAEARMDDLSHGNIALMTSGDGVTIAPRWERASWWDDVRLFWKDFGLDGELSSSLGDGEPSTKPETGAVARKLPIAPGETAHVRFYLSWYFPNRYRGWAEGRGGSPQRRDEDAPLVAKRYTSQFADSIEVAEYVHANRARLEAATFAFRDALFDSSLPATMTRAISANIVPVRSPTSFRLADGSFYGWEGCFDDAGSCAGTCTHVWSYAYTVAYLFPELERSMRLTEFEIETDATGFMHFRAYQALGEEFVWPWDGDIRPAIDGHMGTIIRAWREYQLSGDQEWLDRIWPPLHRSVDYAVNRWDPDRDGFVTEDQHNTYDIDFRGPNPLAQFMYTTGLSAAAAIARALGHATPGDQWEELATKGREASDQLWGGAFYIQTDDNLEGHPHQHGPGCLSDQLLAYVHARANGLPSPVPEDRVVEVYRSIFEHNFRPELASHVSFHRVYAHGDHAGLVLCSWPDGGEPPSPFPYSDEVWTSVEYHVAAGMLWAGLTEEALTLLAAAAGRHDGYFGNPWNEVECGNHYVRPMASYLLLLAALGQRTDDRGAIEFAPRPAFFDENGFRSFYSNGRSWGTIEIAGDSATLTVMGGEPPKSVTVQDVAEVNIEVRVNE